MTTTIITPVFRCSYMNVLQPKKNDQNRWVYSVTMIFEPDADLAEMKDLIERVVQTKYHGKPPAGLRRPFRKGVQISDDAPRGYDLKKNPEYAGKIIASASSYATAEDGSLDETKAPGIIGNDPRKIFDPKVDRIYSGMYARAEISAYKPNGRDMIVLGLHNIQKCYDGEPLGGVSRPAKDAFGVFEVPEHLANNAGLLDSDLFDI